jgi:hypothetical protein
LGSGWGHHHISSEKATRLLDYARLELLVGNVISGAAVLAPDRKLRDDLLKQASDAIEEEAKTRSAEGLPEGYVRDISQYVEYSRDQILDHLDEVCRQSYTAEGLSRPDIDFVCLAFAENQIVAGGTFNYLRSLTGNYNGQFDFLRREVAQTRAAGIASEQTTDIFADNTRRSRSPVSFFGVSAEGSRVAFLLDASIDMLTDDTGGVFGYSFIKKQVEKSISGLPAGAKFNVYLYNGRQLALFRPDMVSADPETLAKLNEWLEPVNSELDHPGIPENEVTPVFVKDYGTIVGSDASSWLLALQIALEQTADVIWIADAEWERPAVSREKGGKLLDFSVWDAWSGGNEVASGGNSSSTDSTGEDGTETVTTSSDGGGAAALGTIAGLKQDKQQRDALLKEALKAIEQEDKERKAKNLPQPFIRDVLSYLCYTAPQIREHLNRVISEEPTSAEEARPVINYICLLPPTGKPAVETMRNLRKLTSDYGGTLVLFRGAGSADEIKRLNRHLDLTD